MDATVPAGCVWDWAPCVALTTPQDFRAFQIRGIERVKVLMTGASDGGYGAKGQSIKATTAGAWAFYQKRLIQIAREKRRSLQLPPRDVLQFDGPPGTVLLHRWNSDREGAGTP